MVSKLQKLLNLTLKTFYQSPSIVNTQKLIDYLNKINLNDEIDLTFIDEANKLINEFNSLKIQSNDYNRLLNRFMKEKEKNYDKNKFLNISIYIQSLQTKTPVLHMEILEKVPVVSLSVFLIKSGCNIPLHNHPNMHGFGKIIYGKGRIISYTLKEPENDEITAKYEFNKEIKSGDILLLEPNKNNVHEIQASNDSDLVLVDLILPPYESNCSFYEILKQKNDDNLVVFKLLDKAPSTYFCESLVFQGPELKI
jgi:cysteamine dioxygenase